MRLFLAPPPGGFLQSYLTRTISAIMGWAETAHTRGTDIEVGEGAALIMTSPDGNRWKVTVSNAGALTVTAI